MHPRTLKAFREELESIEKQSMDPGTLAALVVGGKYLANNAIHEYGHHVPFLRRMAAEIAGVGARTAMQGKPTLGAPLQHLAKLTGEGQLMGLYTNAHRAALEAQNQGLSLPHLKEMMHAEMTRGSGLLRKLPQLKSYANLADKVPLESTGIRKVIDYGFTPVSQVGRDLKEAYNSPKGTVRQSLKSLGGEVASDAKAFGKYVASPVTEPLSRAGARVSQGVSRGMSALKSALSKPRLKLNKNINPSPSPSTLPAASVKPPGQP